MTSQLLIIIIVIITIVTISLMIIISKVCLRPGVNLLMAIAVCRKAALTHGPTMDPVMAERTMMMMVVAVIVMVVVVIVVMVVIVILMRMIALHGKTILKHGLPMRPVIEWMAMITVMMVTMPTMMMIMMISMCIITAENTHNNDVDGDANHNGNDDVFRKQKGSGYDAWSQCAPARPHFTPHNGQ